MTTTRKNFQFSILSCKKKEQPTTKRKYQWKKIDNKLRNKTTKIPEIAKNNLQKQIKNIYKLKYKN